MPDRVYTRAYANIAISKYWGKRPGGKNCPATPSISLAVDCLETRTIVKRLKGKNDRFVINGRPADKTTKKRLGDYLNYWRKEGLISGSFSIDSQNSFPTKSGLASSSSGFAALARGLAEFSEKKVSSAQLTRLARIGSGSAARSVSGGLSKLPSGENPASSIIMRSELLQWGMVIAVVDAPEKKKNSRVGMNLSRESSPYYKKWLAQAKKDYRAILESIEKGNFSAIGKLCEANTLAMHACMMATRPALVYLNHVSLKLIDLAYSLRENRLETYFTMDAGPHVVFLGRKKDLNKIRTRINQIRGVKRCLIGNAAPGAEVLEVS